MRDTLGDGLLQRWCLMGTRKRWCVAVCRGDTRTGHGRVTETVTDESGRFVGFCDLGLYLLV